MTAKRAGLGVVAAGAAVLALFLAGVFGGGTEYVTGMRAGNLDGGNGGGVQAPMKRGWSEMIGDTAVENVGKTPILIESIEPLSTSPALHVTKGRIWRLRRGSAQRKVVMLPMWWQGWPPKNVPKGHGAWRNPRPDYLSLPTKAEIAPGATDQLVYGVFLHADPGPKLRITGLRITFQQDGRTFVWTKPDTFGPLRCTPRWHCGH